MKDISIICANETSTLETIALRGALEYFGFLPKVHWIGSLDQFKEVLEGSISTEQLVVISAHGCDTGFYGTDNAVINLDSLSINLKGKIILSLGCVTGQENFAKAFLSGGAEHYIAPVSYPEGNSSLVFAVIFLWKMQLAQDAFTSWRAASAVLSDTDDAFHYYKKIKGGMLVDGNREIPLQ